MYAERNHLSDILAIKPVDVDCNIQVLLRGFRVLEAIPSLKSHVRDPGNESPPRLLLALALALALIRSRMNTPQIYFDHEKPVAYQRSIRSKSRTFFG